DPVLGRSVELVRSVAEDRIPCAGEVPNRRHRLYEGPAVEIPPGLARCSREQVDHPAPGSYWALFLDEVVVVRTWILRDPLFPALANRGVITAFPLRTVVVDPSERQGCHALLPVELLFEWDRYQPEPYLDLRLVVAQQER